MRLASDGSGDTVGILDEGCGCGLSRCEDCFGQACAQALHAVHGLGRLRLHPVGQFVGSDASRHLRLAGVREVGEYVAELLTALDESSRAAEQ